MREKRNFGENSRKSRTVKKKYFFVFEGEKTEPLYFLSVIDARDVLGIDPIIEFVPIVRSYNEKNWSNPLKILKKVIATVEASTTEIVTYEMFVTWLIDYILEEIHPSLRESNAEYLQKAFDSIIENDFKVEMSSQVVNLIQTGETLFSQLPDIIEVDNHVKMVSDVIQRGMIHYVADYDKISFIFDRDPQSFKENQYDSVRKLCDENRFQLYITNPCLNFGCFCILRKF